MVATILIARWGTESRSPGAVRAALSLRRRRGTQFILCQYPVAVLVELLQGSGSVGDFLFVNDAITVGVKGDHERAGRRGMVAGTGSLGAAILWCRRIGWRRVACILCSQGES